MIEIKQFDGKSITPKDDALVYDLLFNGYGIFNGCSVSFLGANQLLVSSGRLIVRGRQVVITEETVAAQLSSDGTKKGRLYIHIDLSSASNPIEFRTAVADDLPSLTQEDDVNYNDGIFEVELCRYDVSETAISNIVETCPSITGGADLLRTMEEVMANTTSGNAVDALVIKELNESLGLQYIGKIMGNETITIDLSKYSEIVCHAMLMNYGSFSFNIITELNYGSITLLSVNEASGHCNMRVNYTDKTLSISSAVVNGADYKASSYIEVYGRK